MKLASFVKNGQKEDDPALGVMLDEDSLLDLLPAAALYMREEVKEKEPHRQASQLIPTDMTAFLKKGEAALSLARRTMEHFKIQRRKKDPEEIKGLEGEPLIFPLATVALKAPVPRPGKIIAMGLNFYDHVSEIKTSVPEFPLGFLKIPSALRGQDEPIPYPRSIKQLDYEIELAIIIGKKGKDIPPEKAFEYIAGYTIFNDISAREIQAKEMKKRFLLLGKNFDAFAPMGPYLVTREEIETPQDLDMELRINDEQEPRQKSSTKNMVFKIPELISYWSQMTLEPGDIIASGTPGGIALFHQPDPAAWFLKPGDIMEARIQGLGVLRNSIV